MATRRPPSDATPSATTSLDPISQPFGADTFSSLASAQAQAIARAHEGDNEETDEALATPWDESEDPELVGAWPLQDLLHKLHAGHTRLAVSGLQGAQLACLLAQLRQHTSRKVVVITPDGAAGRQLSEDLQVFAPCPTGKEVIFFPAADTSPYGDISPDRQVTLDRLSALFALALGVGAHFTLIPAWEWARKTLPPDLVLSLADVITLQTTNLTNDKLRKILAGGGYTSVSLVEDPGSFAIRGDLVDVWSPFDEAPVRIERWGDDVLSIKTFDPGSQRTKDEVKECYLFPVREILLHEPNVRRAYTRIREAADTCGVPSKKVSQLLDDLRAGLHFIGVEGLFPAFYEALAPLGALVPNDALVVVLEPERCAAAVEHLWDTRQQEYASRVAEHELAFPPEDHYVHLDALQAWLDARPQRLSVRRLRSMASAQDAAAEGDALEFRAKTHRDIIRRRKDRERLELKNADHVEALIPQISEWRDTYGRIVFACATAGETERLRQLLDIYGQNPKKLSLPLKPSEVEPPPAQVYVLQAKLSAGFRTPALGLALLADHEVFGRKTTRVNRAKTFQETSSLASFRDLAPGDLVVHADYGIGRYAGLHKMTVEGIPNDFLIIEYAGRDKLYVPVYRLGRLQKYLGQSDSGRLDKMGGSAWEKTKERVKAELKGLAVDLLALYAKRQAHPGIPFPPPDHHFREFEAAFPYEETEDQLQAISDTMRDMQKPTVMDRLVCGDVGFGKTEVAIRAAFHAVMGGTQVAVLVPTTVLCEQHLASFRSRFQGWPIRVEAVSRFRTKAEVDKILEDAKLGHVDVLIGTHRLISDDVGFRRIGLLIVDEEQRFGVGHKERIKELRTQVDCLTLSATPIPRTLHMAMLGLRDMSVIASPPPGRLAVRTHIARFSETVIREAILRELQRGGQVYFVHNRVQTIHETAEKLRAIVPEARIAIGHGQMKEHELEKVMLGFVQNTYNVLLSTSIVEAGLDIPNANTMIIDRADTFGLSQLYQLRGRIGRSRKRAYCYLLIHQSAKITDIAQERLDVIERFSELGSGFHVASYDLEIRGAGNILGPEQSGTVAAVGLDLYGELLEEAIQEARGEKVERDIEPEVNIPIPAYLPEGYIHDTSLRLLFYKRLSLARSEEELFELYSELVDRFGAAPPEAESLREVIAIKIALRRLRCPRLDSAAGAVHITLGDNPTLTPSQAVALLHAFRGRYSLTPQMKLVRSLTPQEADDRLKAARQVCRELLDAAGI